MGSDVIRRRKQNGAYQAFVWHQCLVAAPIVPSPFNHGWEMVDDEITIKRNTVKPAPEEVLVLMCCTCSKKCVPETCSCIANGLFCTDGYMKRD